MDSDLYYVYCPILQTETDCYTCMDICFVAEGEWPESELPEDVKWAKEKSDICMRCKEHPDVNRF